MKREELIARLRSSAAIMGMLPENPGYNGSVLLIDDTEAARVAKDLDDAVAALTALQSAEHLAPEDDAKAVAAGLPTTDSLVGEHVHLGIVIAQQSCCASNTTGEPRK